MFFEIKFSFVSSVGHKIIESLSLHNFHKSLRKKFNLGYPEILKINLHLKLNNKIKNNGKDDIK